MSFLVNENAPKTHHFGLCNGNRFSKVSAIFGANGSGKTSLICMFEFLRWFISKSFSYSDDGFFVFAPFETTVSKSSVFEVEFYIEGIFYKLSFEINSERVLSEILESRKNQRLAKLYSRRYVPSSNSYKFTECIDLGNDFIEKVRPNASVISTAKQYNHPELTKIMEHWFSVGGGISSSSLFKNDFSFNKKEYYKNKEYFQQAKEFLKKADLGLLDIEIKTEKRRNPKGKANVLFAPYGIHKSKGKIFKLPFILESGGTLHLYDMLNLILPVLKKGSVFLIDEIEKNLHPNILPYIVDLFISKETNPEGAQLICTTHMTTLMVDLFKYQIFFVEKNQECESEVYRLDDVQGVRNDDHFFKKYLAGAYGGIPDIDI